MRDTLRTLTLTTYASNTKEGALGFGPLAAPAAGGRNEEQSIGVQFVHSAFVGSGHYVLTQNRFAANQSTQRTSPYLALPGATVLVRSASDAATSDVASLTLGGNPWLATDDTRWIVEGSNETTWNARGTKHRFRTQLWGRADGLKQEGLPNSVGQYSYNSLADFAVNRPASYTRTLSQPTREGETYNSAVAVSHQWNKSRWFSMLYGARVGFSYTYSRAKDNGNGTSMNQMGVFYRPTMGFVRGGIGEVRNLYKPSMLADAIAIPRAPSRHHAHAR